MNYSPSTHTRALLLALAFTVAGVSVLPGAQPSDAFAESLRTLNPKNKLKLNDSGQIIEINIADSSEFDDEMYRQLGQVASLQKLNLGTTKVTDEQLKLLAPLIQLTALELNGGALTDAAFASLAGLADLKALICWHQGWQREPTMTGSGMAPLASLQHLTHLVLAGSRITDAAIDSIVRIKSLENVEIFHCWKLSDAALLRLAELPNLRHLAVGSVRGEPKGSEGVHVNDAFVRMLSGKPTLESLSLSEGILTYEGSLKTLKNLPALKKLELSEVLLPPGDLEKLQADLPSVAIKHTVPKEKLAAQLNEIQAPRAAK